MGAKKIPAGILFMSWIRSLIESMNGELFLLRGWGIDELRDDIPIIYSWLVVWLPFFGTCFISPYIGNNHPNWLIFFRGVQSTNQINLVWVGFYFCIYWECHHPNWRSHIFQRGGYTTNQIGITSTISMKYDDLASVTRIMGTFIGGIIPRWRYILVTFGWVNYVL